MSKQNARGNNAACISRLEAKVQVRKSSESSDCSERTEETPQLDNEVKSLYFQ